MTDLERRYCPRCGTALVAGMPFCPGCGLKTADVGDRSEPPERDRPDPQVDVLGRPLDEGTPATQAGTATSPDWRPVAAASSGGLRRFGNIGSSGAIVVGAVIVAAGLVVFGLLMRPQPVNGPTSSSVPGSSQGGQVGPGGSPVGPAAPIVGLTIESPQDGQAVATKDVTVIGVAPPGLGVTRDVSFGFDQHATADGTGHWAMSVGLDEGQNDLVFRIGDDHSTEKRVRVIYTPQAP
jgi:hypothetical protein